MRNGPDCTFYAEGSSTALAPDTAGDVTLANSTTYYADIGDPDRSMSSVMWRWASALVALITYERANFPDSEIYAAAGVKWVPTGITAISAPGGSPGVAMSDFANQNAGKMRAKIVVTTGAKLRGRPHHKGL